MPMLAAYARRGFSHESNPAQFLGIDVKLPGGVAVRKVAVGRGSLSVAAAAAAAAAAKVLSSLSNNSRSRSRSKSQSIYV